MSPEDRKSQVNELKNVLRTFTFIVALLGGIPYGIYLGAHTRISTLMLLASPMIAGLLLMAAEMIITKKIAAQFSFYPAAGILLTVLFLQLNSSIRPGERQSVTCSIARADGRAWYAGAFRNSETIKTLYFAGNEFDDCRLLRIFSSNSGKFRSTGKVRMYFENGLFGLPVLVRTEWFDDASMIIMERDE